MAELTVPRAPVIVGRTANVDTTPVAGRAAATMAEGGNRMLEAGLQLQAQRRQRELRRTELNVARDMGQARLEVDQLGDPEQIGPAWDAKRAEIRQRYITDDTDPEVAAALDLSMQELGDRHGLALAGKVVSLERSATEADWIAAREAIVTEAGTADPTTFGALIEVGEAGIDARVHQGLIDPAQGAQEKQVLRQEVYGNRAAAGIAADPAGWMAAAEAGEYDALGGTKLGSLKISAQKELDRRAAAAKIEADKEAKARSDAIGRRLDTIADLALEGRVVVDEAYVNDPEVQTHPKWAEAMAAVALRDEVPDLRQMTVTQLDGLISAEEQKPLDEKFQHERLVVLRATRDKAAAAYAADPVKAAGTQGITVPALAEFDATDPGPFAEGVAARIGFGQWMQDNGYSDRLAIFSNDDRGRLKTVIDPKAPAEPKLALAQSLVAGAGTNVGDALNALDADPVFRRSVRLIGTPGNEQVAGEILRGQQKIALGTVIVPGANLQTRVFDEMTGGVFDGNPALKAEIMATATALYADSAAGIDPESQSGKSWLDDDTAVATYEAAIQRVLGATPDGSGGLQQVNGAPVVLPPGVTADRVEQTTRFLQLQLEGRIRENSGEWSPPDTVAPEQRMRAFTAAGIHGVGPDLADTPKALLTQLQLRREGETDVYEFVYSLNGRPTPVPMADGSGHPYRFHLPSLLREAGR